MKIFLAMTLMKIIVILFAIFFQSCQADHMARHQEAVESVLKKADFPTPLIKKYTCYGKLLKFSNSREDKVLQIEAIVNRAYIVTILFDIKYSLTKNAIIEISPPKEIFVRKIRELRGNKDEKPTIFYDASQEVKMTKDQILMTINNDWSFASLPKSDPSLKPSEVHSLFGGLSVLLEMPQE